MRGGGGARQRMSSGYQPLGDDTSMAYGSGMYASGQLYNTGRPFHRTLEYVFTGKLTLFPVIILATFVSSGILLTYGDLSYSGGYFQSNEVYFGLIGLAVMFVSVGMLVTLVRWMVLKIIFVVTPNKLVVLKHGVYRSSRYEFSTPSSTLYYYRTHFSEDEAWLCLVVKEHQTFYRLCSWRGKGNQRERFFHLFEQLTDAMDTARAVHLAAAGTKDLFNNVKRVTPEIVSQEEVTLINPFTSRLSKFTRRSTTSNQTLCIGDIDMVSYDSLYDHFVHNKILVKESPEDQYDDEDYDDDEYDEYDDDEDEEDEEEDEADTEALLAAPVGGR